MPSERWLGYIKDYDGGTLMECIIYDGAVNFFEPLASKPDQPVSVAVDYLDVPGTLRAQRDHVLELIAGHAQAAQTRAPLDFSSAATGSDPQFYLRNPGAIPGLVEAGWGVAEVSAMLAANLRPSPEVLQAELLMLVDELIGHDDAWPFRERVDKALVPDYYVTIKEPIGT